MERGGGAAILGYQIYPPSSLNMWYSSNWNALDSIALSLFADIFIELTNTVSNGKIQITILILRRGALSRELAFFSIEKSKMFQLDLIWSKWKFKKKNWSKPQSSIYSSVALKAGILDLGEILFQSNTEHLIFKKKVWKIQVQFQLIIFICMMPTKYVDIQKGK